MATEGGHWTIQAEVSLDTSDAEAKLKKLAQMAEQAASPGGGGRSRARARQAAGYSFAGNDPEGRDPAREAWRNFFHKQRVRRNTEEGNFPPGMGRTSPYGPHVDEARGYQAGAAQQNAKATGNKFREIFGKLFNTQNRGRKGEFDGILKAFRLFGSRRSGKGGRNAELIELAATVIPLGRALRAVTKVAAIGGIVLGALVTGFLAVSRAAFKASKSLGTGAYRELRASTIRLNYQWRLLLAAIGDKILPLFSKLADVLTFLIKLIPLQPRGGDVRLGAGTGAQNPGFHTGGQVRRSGMYALRAGETVNTQADQQRQIGDMDTGRDLHWQIYEAIRQLVYDGTLDLLFDRPRLPKLIADPVTVENIGDLSAGAGTTTPIEKLTQTEYTALTDKDARTFYLVTAVPASS